LNAIIDNFRLAFGTFLSHPMRTFLTLLGIVIGAMTVVAMMGMLEGLRIKMTDDMSGLGSNGFQIQREPSGFGRHNWDEIAKRPKLNRGDLEAVAELPNVAAATGEAFSGGQRIATSDRETQPNVLIWGATAQALRTNALDLGHGRFYEETEEADRRAVAVLGTDVADLLFPDVDPLGKSIRVNNRPFRVVGVLTRKGASLMGGSQDNMVLIPLGTFESLFGAQRSLNISIQAASADVMDRAQEEVRLLMRRRHNLQPHQEDDFALYSNESATQMLNQLSSVVTAASFGICLLSLIVGGIGILNIMLVSVTERTKEIGIRKALGAKKRRILAQFATEAVLLSLVGGVLGVLLGLGISGLARWLIELPTQVPMWAMSLSLGMSMVVGLSFGIYPAARAAALDPVEAMRAD